MIHLTTIQKNQRNQNKALKEMFALFPKSYYGVTSTSFNSRNHFTFEVHADHAEFSKIATSIYANRDSLFDMGKPRLVTKGWHIYEGYYFKLGMRWTKEFPFLIEDGNKMNMSITLDCKDFNIGLGKWKEDYEKTFHLLDNCPNKELKEKYIKSVLEADNEVDKWKLELKALSKLGNQV